MGNAHLRGKRQCLCLCLCLHLFNDIFWLQSFTKLLLYPCKCFVYVNRVMQRIMNYIKPPTYEWYQNSTCAVCPKCYSFTHIHGEDRSGGTLQGWGGYKAKSSHALQLTHRVPASCTMLHSDSATQWCSDTVLHSDAVIQCYELTVLHT